VVRIVRGGTDMTRRARGLRLRATDTERALWQGLRYKQLGARFRRQYPIPPYVVDFVCVEARLIVEADGSQHALSGADTVRDRRLSKAGWQILRFWDNDILQNRTGVLQMIAEALTCRMKSAEIVRQEAPTPTLPRKRGREQFER
jgi:very-short-patch-repair endonuclease